MVHLGSGRGRLQSDGQNPHLEPPKGFEPLTPALQEQMPLMFHQILPVPLMHRSRARIEDRGTHGTVETALILTVFETVLPGCYQELVCLKARLLIMQLASCDRSCSLEHQVYLPLYRDRPGTAQIIGEKVFHPIYYALRFRDKLHRPLCCHFQ